MTNAQAAKYEAKLEAVMASTIINSQRDCANVASSTSANEFYMVEISGLYSTSCTCEGATRWHEDCIHRLAVDRLLDSERPSFYATLESEEVAEETVSIDEAMEEAQEAMEEHIDEAARKGEAVAMAKMVSFKLSSQYVAAPSSNDVHFCAQCGRELRGSQYVCGGCVGY